MSLVRSMARPRGRSCKTHGPLRPFPIAPIHYGVPLPRTRPSKVLGDVGPARCVALEGEAQLRRSREGCPASLQSRAQDRKASFRAK